FSSHVTGKAHRQTRFTHNHGFVGHVEVVRRYSKEEVLAVAHDPGRSIKETARSSAGHITCFINESLARVDHVTEGQFIPVEELLVPGSAGTEHQGEFSVDRQVVGIDQPQHGSLDGSLSLHVMCCEHTEPTGNVFEV